MGLSGKLLDDLIISERRGAYKSLLEEKPPPIVIENEDGIIIKDMEDKYIWLKKLPSKKILD